MHFGCCVSVAVFRSLVFRSLSPITASSMGLFFFSYENYFQYFSSLKHLLQEKLVRCFCIPGEPDTNNKWLQSLWVKSFCLYLNKVCTVGLSGTCLENAWEQCHLVSLKQLQCSLLEGVSSPTSSALYFVAMHRTRDFICLKHTKEMAFLCAKFPHWKSEQDWYKKCDNFFGQVVQLFPIVSEACCTTRVTWNWRSHDDQEDTGQHSLYSKTSSDQSFFA